MMKIPTTALLIILICSISLQGQQYFPFPAEDAQWNIYLLTTCDNDSPPDTFLLRYALHGDTVINDLAYGRLCLETGDLIDPLIEPVGAIREEDRRIYYIGQGFLGSDFSEEVLLYDFTAEVGDTIDHTETRSFRSIVLETDSIQIDGEYRKMYTVDNGWYYHNPDLIVEGIGSIKNGLLGHVSDIPTCGTHFWEHVCFSEKGEVRYRNPVYSDCYAGTVKSYKSIFGRDTTQWNYLTSYNVADLLYTLIYKAYGDTLVNDVNYRFLYEDAYQWGMESEIIGMIREDTMTGRVWVRYLEDTADYLIMDLNLDVNDTFLIPNKIDSNYDKKVKVEEIAYNQYGKNVVLAWNYGCFIEGVGTDIMIRDFESSTYYELLCAYKDNEIIYVGPRDTCNLWISTGIPEVRQGNFKIYPNPASGPIMFETDEAGPWTVWISGVDGQLLYSTKVEEYNRQIDLSPFGRGVYFITVRSRDFVVTRKVVKY
jgi:hypothetical protein